MLGAALRRPKVVEEFDFDSDVRIGRGSYGQVYKVRNKEDGRYYAVKEVELSSFSPATHREIAVSLICFPKQFHAEHKFHL